MNPVLQEILHNITTRLAALEKPAQSEKLLVDLIQEQRAEIDRLRQALAQPEQEPVAWRKKANGVWHYFDESTPFPFDDCEPLYEKN